MPPSSRGMPRQGRGRCSLTGALGKPPRLGSLCRLPGPAAPGPPPPPPPHGAEPSGLGRAGPALGPAGGQLWGSREPAVSEGTSGAGRERRCHCWGRAGRGPRGRSRGGRDGTGPIRRDGAGASSPDPLLSRPEHCEGSGAASRRMKSMASKCQGQASPCGWSTAGKWECDFCRTALENTHGVGTFRWPGFRNRSCFPLRRTPSFLRLISHRVFSTFFVRLASPCCKNKVFYSYCRNILPKKYVLNVF